MIVHPTIRCLAVAWETNPLLADFSGYLEAMPHVKLSHRSELPADLGGCDLIVTARSAETAQERPDLIDFVAAGGGWLALVDGLDRRLPEPLGVQPSVVGPAAELRVLFEKSDHRLAARLPAAIYVGGRCQFLEPAGDEAEVILHADWHYRHKAMLSSRRFGSGSIACTTLQAYDHPVLQQILYRVMLGLAGKPPQTERLGVGLLGYPPWLGRYHGTAIGQIDGLQLEAVCDINPQRREAALAAFPQSTAHPDADALADDDRVQLVLVSTPPDTHSRLSLQMIAAGKHVVCEKPLALNRRETNRMAAEAEKHRVHLSCHQNRRWDVDYLSIRQAIGQGQVGELFYLETFVGGFQHPCGYWHSHAPVSGGLAYDWGGHYLDWIVSLVPDAPTAVIGTRHKRVWHDVTNADQERIQIRFAGNQEAEFLHSDIAAALKPKWYLLGTEGAIIGHWRQAAALETDPVLYYRQEPIPTTETAPELILHRRNPGAHPSSQRLVMPQRQPFGFHYNLADHLLTGEPLAAPLEDSMTVVAILEAAARSAARGGGLERIDG